MATQNSIDSAFPIVNNTLGSWTPAAGTITSADTILSALQKISGSAVAITIGSPANGLSYSSGTLSLIAASSGVTGALTGTDWDTFSAKQPLITAGTTAQYYRGDKTFQTLDTLAVPENTNLYYTAARFNTAFSAKSTTDLTEGTNLYYTAARFNTAFAGKTTADLTENTNLYYTNARGIGSLLTGYVSGAGTVASTDTILQAIQKLNGNITAAGGTVTSVSVTTANGVSGSVATATTTPAITLTLGAITPSTVNKVTITAPATAATLTIANNKTVTVNNSLTLSGTDSTTMTFPTTTATIARTDAAQTFTGAQTFNTAIVVGSGGTGVATTTAYAVLCGGTTSTGALQSVSGVGTTGQILTSNGAGALPTWQASGATTTYPSSVISRSSTDFLFYSDDTTLATKNAGSSSIYLISGGLTKANNGATQSITFSTIWASATECTSVIIVSGYVYAYLNNGVTSTRIYRCAITSDIATAGNWTQLTISGAALESNSNAGLAGYGNGTFWVIHTTNGFVPYSLSGTTLTSSTAVTVTGANYDVTYSRVNGTGIYAYFSSGAPSRRFASFAGTLDNTKQMDCTTTTAFVNAGAYYLRQGSDNRFYWNCTF